MKVVRFEAWFDNGTSVRIWQSDWDYNYETKEPKWHVRGYGKDSDEIILAKKAIMTEIDSIITKFNNGQLDNFWIEQMMKQECPRCNNKVIL